MWKHSDEKSRKRVWPTDWRTDWQRDRKRDELHTYSPLRYHRWGTKICNIVVHLRQRLDCINIIRCPTVVSFYLRKSCTDLRWNKQAPITPLLALFLCHSFNKEVRCKINLDPKLNTEPGWIFNGFLVELWPSLAVGFWARCWILTPSWIAILNVGDT